MPRKNEVVERQIETPVESIPDKPKPRVVEPEAMAPIPPPSSEKQEICKRMGEIEKEYGGFSNIPVTTPPHEYFQLRTKLQSLP